MVFFLLEELEWEVLSVLVMLVVVVEIITSLHDRILGFFWCDLREREEKRVREKVFKQASKIMSGILKW